jgi:hypothetical protein
MKKLLYKELRLALQAPAVLFLLLSAMLIIPNYPYYVTFFYTTLGIFFCCQLGRENNDVYYTLSLPVRKRDAVTARFLLAVLLEAAQALVAVPFAFLRQSIASLGGNAVGMDANVALFGLSLAMLGLFNLTFFPAYYKDTRKVGVPFVKGSVVLFVYIVAAEVCAHAVPFFRDRLDTMHGAYLPEKLIVLAAGLALWALLTLLAWKTSVGRFEKLDL